MSLSTPRPPRCDADNYSLHLQPVICESFNRFEDDLEMDVLHGSDPNDLVTDATVVRHFCLIRCSSSFLHVLLAAHSNREGASLVRLSVLPVIPESGAQLNGRTGGPTERPKGDEDDSLLVVAVPHGQASDRHFRLGGIITP